MRREHTGLTPLRAFKAAGESRAPTTVTALVETAIREFRLELFHDSRRVPRGTSHSDHRSCRMLVSILSVVYVTGDCICAKSRKKSENDTRDRY